jgi:hypothetical protein
MLPYGGSPSENKSILEGMRAENQEKKREAGQGMVATLEHVDGNIF